MLIYCCTDCPFHWMLVKLHSFENDFASNCEEVFQLGYHGVVLLSVLFQYILADVRTSPASSPVQYKRVLICQTSPSVANPEAAQHCLNWGLPFGQSLGCLKSNAFGGSGYMLAIPLLTTCSVN